VAVLARHHQRSLAVRVRRLQQRCVLLDEERHHARVATHRSVMERVHAVAIERVGVGALEE
jgi:hypothetical protein